MTASFPYDVEVDPTWTAIQAALDAAPTTGNARIRVRPGTLPVGLGNGSTDNPVLYGGPASRASKILIVPRDGYGTVVANPASTIASQASTGYSFAMQNVAMLGFDFSAQGVVYRSCSNFAAGWSTYGVMNVTANAGNSDALEFVECVLPGQVDLDADRSAVRVANGYSVNDILFVGMYGGPAYKVSGSSSHCDTLQFSGTGGGGIVRAKFVDSILFQSSSQVFMAEVTGDVDIDHSAFIGGLRATGRFPIASGRHIMTAQNTLWGSAQTAKAKDAVVMGSMSSSYGWSGSSGSKASTQATMPAGWTAEPAWDGQSTLQTAWLNANSPVPTPAYLASVWAAL